MDKKTGHLGHDVVCGGFGPTEKATDGFVILCYQFKSRAEAITNKRYAYFTAISYRAQVVAGTNYIFKICVGGENYIHMKAFWELPCNGGLMTVTGVQENKTKTEPIEPF